MVQIQCLTASGLGKGVCVLPLLQACCWMACCSTARMLDGAYSVLNCQWLTQLCDCVLPLPQACCWTACCWNKMLMQS
jgi:hypothetical protein